MQPQHCEGFSLKSVGVAIKPFVVALFIHLFKEKKVSSGYEQHTLHLYESVVLLFSAIVGATLVDDELAA